MASTWWRQLFVYGGLPSILLSIPVFIILFDHPFWAAFIIWWLKPFWERLPLYFASRRIFGDDSMPGNILLQTGLLYKKDAIPWLLWRRFSLQRAFDAPVTVLEGLKAKPRRKRLDVLHGKYSDVAVGNQFISFCFEWIFSFGIAILLFFFIPDDFGLDIYDSVDDLNLAGQRLYALCWVVAMTLVMPFHTMAGFALYLNRRIELEAWDIEITFRNLANRKQEATKSAAGLLVTILLAILIGSTTPSTGHAAVGHDSASAKQLIDEVLKGADFGYEKTVRKWRFKNMIEENRDKIPEWFIAFIEWLESFKRSSDFDETAGSGADWFKIALIAFAVLLIIYLLYRYRGPLGRFRGRKKTESAPEIMFGLDVRPESLPDDVPAQVMALWKSGKQRDALGLLYRASLSRLIEQHAVAFKSSHTELECAGLVREKGIDSLTHYFAKLTRVWRHLAYGHESPEKGVMQQLCDGWSQEMSDAL